MAKIRRKYIATVKEMSIDCGGLSFLTLCGRHINGAYVSFINFWVSAELAVDDVYWNKVQIFEALKHSGDSWLPKSDAALEKIAAELAETITAEL